MMEASADLAGRRVLLVEDQMLVAIAVEAILNDLGCVVVGPVGSLDAAARVAREETFDAAILDVNVGDEAVFPIAEDLKARGVPFVFTTGYGESAIPEHWRASPRLGKPFRPDELASVLRGLFGR
jgi:DNA-binding response OmpR family regulator